MIEFISSRSCSASRKVNIIQNIESWIYVINGVNKEHYVSNFIYIFA